MFGFIKRLFGVPAPKVAAVRTFSDAEAQARIRNLLNDSRFKFRTLGRLARAIGRETHATDLLLSGMADVREARNNYRRDYGKRLYTFA